VLLHDKTGSRPYCAAYALRCLGPVAADALPDLIECLKEPARALQVEVVCALGAIHQEPERVVPLLVEILAKPEIPRDERELHGAAILALTQFGPQAKLAVPRLIQLATNADASVREDAAEALKQIGPAVGRIAGRKP